VPCYRERGTVGLLGGSFNPAHDGHRHITVNALARLDLDEVWWLVSPQNPLKASAGMAPLAERLAGARRVARHPRIRVLDIERRLGTRYTADTLAALQERFPDIRFVWLTGADILSELPRWARWTEIFQRVPVAVFARPSYVLRAMAGKAATRFAHSRAGTARERALPYLPPPAWSFLMMKLHPASATALRAARTFPVERQPAGHLEDDDNTSP
jgi:nicotinate-nucleotide adenylyltransferase